MSKDDGLVKEGRMRSFGRIASRLSPEEQQQLEEQLKAYAVELPEQGHVDVRRVFPHAGPLVVELGMGKGEQIVERAQKTPDTLFLGCEVFLNGLQKVMRRIDEYRLNNLRLYPGDARELLEKLADNSVDQLLILYPDPWPKTKHKKRRIVQQDLLDEAARVLHEEGELVVVTDYVDYALWILAEVYNHGAFAPPVTGPDEWSTPPPFWHPTGYEKKAKREGRRPFYFVFQHKMQVETQAHTHRKGTPFKVGAQEGEES